MPTKLKIFVYGTLMRGASNHSLLEGQRFLGVAYTEPLYKLYSLGDYPAMVPAPSGGVSVYGEIWEVDPACLVCLDALEGRAEGIYERLPIKLLPPDDQLPVQAYVYQLSVAGRTDLGFRWTSGRS